jgi:hypothetical protein
LNLELYKRSTGFVLGFHGCDKEVGEAVLAGKMDLKMSENPYDWLGRGIYFWEGNPARALQFAQEAVALKPHTTQGTIREPFVVGAIIDRGLCFSLQDTACLAELSTGYDALKAAIDSDLGAAIKMPVNHGNDEDRSARFLDRAVIESMMGVRVKRELPEYDTVTGAFSEGGALFTGSAIYKQGHIQIAVRNPDECILGYFRPRQPVLK